ncbi:hypothetical protein, partial [Novosphingobium sp.]|uniref:hypothetical protein n=1 Tax=Novosphingobium sp. TaxID=1874826 RepID=UPI002C463A2D
MFRANLNRKTATLTALAFATFSNPAFAQNSNELTTEQQKISEDQLNTKAITTSSIGNVSAPTYGALWPAAGLVDTEIGCFHLSE